MTIAVDSDQFLDLLEREVFHRDSRSARLIYRDNAGQTQKNDDYHMTKADKRAGWILLGVFTFFVIVEIANGGDF